MIRIDAISTFDRIRQADRRHVDALADSILEVGLLNPVTVCPRDGGFVLIAGMHRMEACRSLGWDEIPATILDLDQQRQIIAECDENLCAPVLSASERAMFTRRRKEAYEALHPETKHGGDRKSDQVANLATRSDKDRFTADTAAKTGQSERAVQRDAERGAKVSDEALDAVRGTKLDTGRYLDTLKSVPPDEQAAKVQADLTAPPASKDDPDSETEEDPATAKARRDLAKLTPAALIDDVIGLRADVADAKADARTAKAEIAELKEKLRDFDGDSAEAIRRLQKAADYERGKAWRATEEQGRLQKQIHALKKRIGELENMGIPLNS
ncbi:ParB N-terminal domain-containing protein [Paracoccus sp. IB05]|uniref:ParB N-terminal domain-containing protein n=1 Tax=Paracoccus sp. IB05 TaxID=2779367 RepID=UPI0018E82015|nr:ParB N-terminal domain-containing protein [Paracoccus sp. IB05]MBJ2153990.1 ParB N-terminal domain-containing protein [Paracoccus sp. IB05]